jgi:hypothetical protein
MAEGAVGLQLGMGQEVNGEHRRGGAEVERKTRRGWEAHRFAAQRAHTHAMPLWLGCKYLAPMASREGIETAQVSSVACGGVPSAPRAGRLRDEFSQLDLAAVKCAVNNCLLGPIRNARRLPLPVEHIYHLAIQSVHHSQPRMHPDRSLNPRLPYSPKQYFLCSANRQRRIPGGPRVHHNPTCPHLLK